MLLPVFLTICVTLAISMLLAGDESIYVGFGRFASFCGLLVFAGGGIAALIIVLFYIIL